MTASRQSSLALSFFARSFPIDFPAPSPALPFVIGDLQGCCAPLDALLTELDRRGAGRLWFAGDLINRGPGSLATLRTVMALGERATAVLGNHDLHLLAVAAGVRTTHRSDTLDDILHAPDRDALIDWIRHRPLAHYEDGYLLVHAGVLPQWDVARVLELAAQVQAELRGPDWRAFLSRMFGNHPDRWRDDLAGDDRLRITINALTRLRFCSAHGVIDFKTKEGPGTAPAGFMPWFDVPDRKSADATVVFGHWSTLGLILRDNLIGTDTGCVWGGKLSAIGLSAAPNERPVVQIACAQAQRPGRA